MNLPNLYPYAQPESRREYIPICDAVFYNLTICHPATPWRPAGASRMLWDEESGTVTVWDEYH